MPPCPAEAYRVDSDFMEMYSRIMEKRRSSLAAGGGDLDVEQRIARRLRELRGETTLEALALHSGVSRSMISLIERGEASPTASVLNRLAAGLGVTIAAFFDHSPHADAAPLARRAAQPEWTDPDTGYVRRNLSPPGHRSALQLIEVVLPAGAQVSYDPAVRSPAQDQQVWVIEGRVRISVGSATHDLEAGDCLAMQVDQVNSFRNRSRQKARYLVALAAAAPARRG